MKHLIKLLFLGIMLLSFNLAHSQIVGKIVDDQTVFTIDKTELLSVYNANMNEVLDKEPAFTSVEVIKYEENLYLVFFNEDKTLRSALAIIIEQDENEYVLNVQGEMSCTTIDCAQTDDGCLPIIGSTYCSACGIDGECTKITSDTSLIERK